MMGVDAASELVCGGFGMRLSPGKELGAGLEAYCPKVLKKRMGIRFERVNPPWRSPAFQIPDSA